MTRETTAAAARPTDAHAHDATTAAAAPATPHRLALPAVLAGLFMTILDFSVVNVAIPSIQRGLHAGAAEIQFVVAGYGLAYGAGLVTGGRLGDRFGRRRLYLAGTVAFTLSSALCGLAPTAVALVVGRLLQGAAAALLFPQVLSILNVSYTGSARSRAFRWYGLVLGTAWVGGQVLGGVLIKADLWHAGWRICFLINLPVGAASAVLARLTVAESRSAAARRLDLRGVALVTAGLALLVYPLVEGREAAWPAWSFGCLAAAPPVLAAFLRSQARLSAAGGTPLVEPALLRSRPFLLGIATVFATYAGMASFFLVFAVYLQEGEGYDALGSGLAFLPLGVGFFATSLLGGRVDRLLGRRAISVGAAVLAASELLLAVVASAGGARIDAWGLALPLAFTGVGMGMVLTPLIARVLSGIDPDHAGSAAGVLSTMQQVGNCVGVALIGVLFYSHLNAGTAHGLLYAHAFVSSLILEIVIAGCVGVLALFLP